MAKFTIDGKEIEVPDSLVSKIQGEARSDERNKAKELTKEILAAMGVEKPEGSLQEMAAKISAEISGLKQMMSAPKPEPDPKPGEKPAPVSDAEMKSRIEKAIAEKEKELLKQFDEKNRENRVGNILNDIRAGAIASGLKASYRELLPKLVKDNFEIELETDKNYFYKTVDGKKMLFNGIDEVNANIRESYPDLFETAKPGFQKNGVKGTPTDASARKDMSADQMMAAGIASELSLPA